MITETTMSKKATQTSDSVESGQSAIYDDLLKNGTTILEAPTREELTELVNGIPSDCKYCVGAVGRKQDGSAYTLQVDIVNN